MIENNNNFSEISNKISSSISTQQDNIIFEVLRENNIDYTNLPDLIKNTQWIIQENKKNKKTLTYKGRGLLEIYDSEISFDKGEVKCEVKYKKLYENK